MRPGASIMGEGTVCRDSVFVRWAGSLPGADDRGYNASCSCNEYVGLRNRVLAVVPPCQPNRQFTLRFREAVRRFKAQMEGKVRKYTIPEVCQSFAGAKRKLYERAAESLVETPFRLKDAELKAFVKQEKVSLGEQKDPRIIQARGPRYNILVMQYLRSVERELGNLKLVPWGVGATCKGLSSHGRAKRYLRMVGQFSDPVVIGLDASRFDMHVSQWLLKEEHKLYCALYPKDRWLPALLKLQLQNRGITMRAQMRYSNPGGRASGDVNTSLGNHVIMMACAYAALGDLPPRTWDMLCDGDDCLVVCERRILDAVQARIEPGFLQFGLRVVCELPVAPYKVEHCQARLYRPWGQQPRFVRNPTKAVANFASHYHWLHNVTAARRYFATLACAEHTCQPGIPIFWAMAKKYHEFACGSTCYDMQRSMDLSWRVSLEGGLKAYEEIRPDANARIAFAEAFDMSVEEQLVLESTILNLAFPELRGYHDANTSWTHSRGGPDKY